MAAKKTFESGSDEAAEAEAETEAETEVDGSAPPLVGLTVENLVTRGG
jgi:hypothetical protein